MRGLHHTTSCVRIASLAFTFARSVSHVQVLFAMVLRLFVQTDGAMCRKSRAGRSNCGLTALRSALPASPWWDEAATDKPGTATCCILGSQGLVNTPKAQH